VIGAWEAHWNEGRLMVVKLFRLVVGVETLVILLCKSACSNTCTKRN
jgi:hypothetical protein